MRHIVMNVSALIKTTLATLLVASVVSCGGTNGNESDSTRETDEEIEEARMAGRNTARNFINREWNDSVQLQHELLKAKSVQSKYLIKGKHRSAAAFDTAFIRTIRTVHPELARKLQ